MPTVPNGGWSGLLVGGFLLASAPGAVFGQDTDARWYAWLGCWEAVAQDAVPGAGQAAGDAMICLRPATGDVGVEMLSVAGSEITSRQIVRADGQMHETENEGCAGWEMASFSEDSERVYLRTDHLCDGDVRRATTGLIAMVTPDEWIDVRAVEYSGRSLAGVVRYRLAPIDRAEAAGLGDIGSGISMAVRAARMRAAADVEVDDVIEANENVDDEAVRAWVAEAKRPLELNAAELVRLADAGVPPEVIDVVVAVSYPERFAVAEDQEVRDEADRYGRADPGPWGYSRRPYFWDPFYYGGYGYSGYGYGYGYGGYYRPVVVVVEPRNPGPVSRIINGRGYSSGRPRSGDSSSGPSGSPARSDGGGSSSDGASSGGSRGTSTGRTARPRPPGGQ